jgi:hypothetical protein
MGRTREMLVKGHRISFSSKFKRSVEHDCDWTQSTINLKTARLLKK